MNEIVTWEEFAREVDTQLEEMGLPRDIEVDFVDVDLPTLMGIRVIEYHDGISPFIVVTG